MRIIGRVRTPYPEKFGVPRQAGMVPGARGQIILEEDLGRESVEGLDRFSHLWTVFLFDRVGEDETRTRVRPPRLGGNEKLGVLATRSPFRPNRLGLSVLLLEGIRQKGGRAVLDVSGVDLVDGTPVLDVKPYLPYADCLPQATSDLAAAPPPELKVEIAEQAAGDFKALPPESRELITGTLRWDPRPAYHEGGRVYHASLGGVDVDWVVEEGACRIVGVRS